MASRRSSRSSSSGGDDPPAHLLVGVCGRAVGLRGDVEVAVDSDDPHRFDPGSRLLLGPGLEPLTVIRSRTHNDRRVVGFVEVPDRTAAEALAGRDLLVLVGQARDLDPGEWWDHELIGCRAVTPSGVEIGLVTALMHPPGNDLLVVEAPDGREHLVPLVAAIVVEVDTAGRRIVVDPIPGLLE